MACFTSRADAAEAADQRETVTAGRNAMSSASSVRTGVMTGWV